MLNNWILFKSAIFQCDTQDADYIHVENKHKYCATNIHQFVDVSVEHLLNAKWEKMQPR